MNWTTRALDGPVVKAAGGVGGFSNRLLHFAHQPEMKHWL